MDYFERKLDDKNRLTIPAELRDEFSGNKVIITQGFGNYLHIYTDTVWNTQVEPALKGDILSEKTADLNVQFRMGRVELEMDEKQGRIALPKHLVEYAGIDSEVVAVRAGQYWRLMPKP